MCKNDRHVERWLGVGQLAATIDKVSAFTALTGSLDANDLSKKDRGRRSEFDPMLANFIEGRIPSDSLIISAENASQEDGGNEVKVAVQRALKEQDINFNLKQVKNGKKLCYR